MAKSVLVVKGVSNEHKVLEGRTEGTDHSDNLCVDERIILKWILGKCIGLMWLRIGTDGVLL
jgi:hypothetical protein